MKKGIFAKWAFLSISATALAYILSHESKSQAPQLTTAFTLDYTEFSQDIMTGRSIQKQQLYWAARSNGDESFGWKDQRYGWRTIRYFAQKTEVTVADPQKLKTTFDYSYLPFSPRQRSYASDCRTDSGPTFLDLDAVNGFKAYRYRRQQILNDSSRIETDTWYAPDLNCYPIQSIAHKYNADGALSGVFEKKTTQIALGEPSGQLFKIPDDYAEVKESERNKVVLLQDIADREGSAATLQYSIPAHIQQYWITRDELYKSVKDMSFDPFGTDGCPTCPNKGRNKK